MLQAPEVAKAKDRAVRSRENAARAAERARAQMGGEEAAEALEQTATAVRRRIAGKHTSPPAFPPAPAADVDAELLQEGQVLAPDSPCGAVELDSDGGSSFQIQSVPLMPPFEDGDLEIGPTAMLQDPEIAKAKDRAVRSRENAARAAERSRAQMGGEEAAEAL